MSSIVFSVICLLLIAAIAALTYYLIKFLRIIMVFEDDLSEAINKLTEVEQALDGILTMQLFFDSPEVKNVVYRAMETIRMAKFSVNSIIGRFTQRSKQQYIITVEEQPPEEELTRDFTNKELAMMGPGVSSAQASVIASTQVAKEGIEAGASTTTANKIKNG